MLKDTLRQQLEKIYPDSELSRWFDPLDMDTDESGGVLRVSFPHAFFCRWFMGCVKQDFEKIVLPFLKDMTIIYEKADFPGRKSIPSAHSGSASLQGIPGISPSVNVKSSLPLLLSPPYSETGLSLQDSSGSLTLQTEHSFDSFLVNRKNDVVLAAAKEAAANMAASCTPFVLYGQSGTGKSHLLGAMGNCFKSRGTDFFYGGIEFLESHSLSVSGFARMPEQAVLLDNAQLICSFPALHDVLVTLIDAFRSAKKLLVIALDMHPAHCPGLGQKLRSRLSSGLVLELKKPDMDIRCQYVQRQNQFHGLMLPKSHIVSIAQRFPDLRGIDGFLTRLLFFREMEQKQENGDAKSLFSDPLELLERDNTKNLLTHGNIITTVARHFSLSPDDIAGKSRDKKVTLARHIAVLLCRELLGLSLPQVGRLFGNRDHTSVLHSIKRIRQLQESDKDVHNEVETLRKLCLHRE